MDHDRAFLQNVVEAPDDDAPRLLYADWLDDHGQSDRAEFIRVQVQLARLAEDDERRPALLGRELQLFRRWHKGWAGSLRSWVRRWAFRRGFVEGVTVRADQFLRRGEELFNTAPVRSIHLTAYADHAAALASSPLLARVRSLELTDPQLIRGQRESRENGRIIRAENSLGTESLRSVLRSRHLTGIRSLAAVDHNLANAGAEMLAASPLLDRLEALNLRNNDFGEGSVAAIVRSGRLGRLRRLSLGACFSFDNYDRFPADGVGMLPPQVAPIVGQLEHLDMGSCGVLPAALVLFARQERRVPLRTLLLERSVLARNWYPARNGQLPTAIRSPWFHDLHTLDLSSCYIEKDAADLLANTPGLARLVNLGLRNNPLGVDGITALAASPHLNRLTRLELAGSSSRWREGRGNYIGDDGARALAGATGLPRLAALDLRRNRITAEGARALAGSPSAARLYFLELRHNRLGDGGAAALLAADWPRLAWLDLRDNGLSAAAKQALRNRFGHAVRY